MNSIAALGVLTLFAVVAHGQFIPHAYNLISDPSLALHSAPIALPLQGAPAIDTSHIAHPAVLENAAMEDHVPAELKNHQYKDPVIAAGLAKESWLDHKEMLVGHRDADDVPRSEIFKIFERAGFHH